MIENENMNKLKTFDDLNYFKDSIELFKAIEDGNEADACGHLKKPTNEADKWVVRKNTDGSVTWRRLPIHEACIRNPSILLLDALLKAAPEGVKALDACGRLPIHHCCVHGASEEVIMKLILAYPESIEAKDMWGKNPLDIAEVSRNENRNKICAMLSMDIPYYYRRLIETEWKGYLKMEREKYDKKITTLEEKWSSKLENAEKTANKQQHELEKNIKNLSEELKDFTTKFEFADKKCKEQALELQQLNKCLYAADKTFNDSKYTYDQTVTELRVKAAEDEKQILSLRESVANMKLKINELDTSNLKTQEENITLQNSIENVCLKSSEEAKIIKKLQENLKKKDDDLKSCKRELSVVAVDLSGSRVRNEETKKALSKLLSDNACKAEQYHANIESLKEEMLSRESIARNKDFFLEEKIRSQQEESNETIAALTNKLETMTTLNNKYEKQFVELKKTEKDYFELKHRVGTLQGSLHSLNLEKSKVFEAVDVQKEELRKAEFARSTAAYHLKKVQSDLDTVLDDMTSWKL